MLAKNKAVYDSRVIDEQAGLFMKIDLLLRQEQFLRKLTDNRFFRIFSIFNSSTGKTNVPRLMIQLIGTDLEKKVVFADEGNGDGVVVLIGF